MARADAQLAGLIRANAPDLLAYFVRRVEHRADAADLLGDTLLVVWRKVRRLPVDDDQARMWMFGIARRVLSGHHRSRRRHGKLLERLRQELRVLPSDVDERVVDVRRCLSELDPTDQEIIRLVHWDGFSQVEVAALLGMPEGTVRSRHARARQRLAALLDADSPARSTE